MKCLDTVLHLPSERLGYEERMMGVWLDHLDT